MSSKSYFIRKYAVRQDSENIFSNRLHTHFSPQRYSLCLRCRQFVRFNAAEVTFLTFDDKFRFACTTHISLAYWQKHANLGTGGWEFISRYFCSSRVQIETRVEVWEWNGTRTGCSNTRRQIILKSILYENVICVQIEKNDQSRFFFIILLILLMLELIFQRKKVARLDICKKDWEKSLANLIFDNFYESTYF